MEVNPAIWLAHYTSAETAFEHIIPSGSLLMNPYERMRDPFENQGLFFRTYTGSRHDQSGALDDAADAALRTVRGPIRLTSFTQGVEGLQDAGNTLLHAAPWARPRMWEQYAENHAGVCLVFDRGALLANLDRDDYHAAEVGYTVEGYAGTYGASGLDLSDSTLETVEADVVEHVGAFFEDFFFVKQEDWATEREFRIVYGRGFLGASNADPNVPSFLPVSHALRYVVLGERFPDWQVPAAQFAVRRRSSIELRRMTWTDGTPYPALI